MNLPSGWQIAPLREVADEVKGSITPSPGTTYELWSVPSFSEGHPEILDGDTIGSAKRPVQPGDVLICKINPRINRVWEVRTSTDLPQIASPEWITVRPNGLGRVTPSYLRWYLSSPTFRDWIRAEVSGVTGSHTRAKPAQVLAQQVPFPTLNEQRRIVEIIEEHFSHLDAADASLTLASRRAAALSASVLEPEWRSSEDQAPLSTWGKIITGSTPKQSDSTSEQIPFLTPGDIAHGARIAAPQRAVTPAPGARVRLVDQAATHAVCVGATLGKVGWTDYPLTMNQQINSVLTDGGAPMAQVLAHLLAAPSGQRELRAEASATTMPILNKTKFSRVRVPYLDAQNAERALRRIASTVDQTQRLEQEISQSRARQDTLRRAVLAAAFSGRLTGASSDADVIEETAEAHG